MSRVRSPSRSSFSRSAPGDLKRRVLYPTVALERFDPCLAIRTTRKLSKVNNTRSRPSHLVMPSLIQEAHRFLR
ncbi:hypothetical protein PCANC_22493 [Puccinia coronata f. sp. avenae]|uniref:Uncharacterized protein n=1 Tax=Puccinia coronata f. sp. avenae TaxID=200324 RepID=A0A2N5U1W3_9BASI|nr:hypothetical protein PCANC_22493 [Puccinia coronata f. sp. avenae]